jgi:hypothetical protein
MSVSPLGLPGINKVVAPKKIGIITLVHRDTEPKAKQIVVRESQVSRGNFQLSREINLQSSILVTTSDRIQCCTVSQVGSGGCDGSQPRCHHHRTLIAPQGL